MKRIFTLTLFLFISLNVLAQTDGISYQAVIIGPDALELPGVDSENNYLPSATVSIRFTIFDSGNQVEFQEVQTTTTDEFGRINLIIGAVEHDYFETISWDGTAKDLAVEIDFEGGSNFVDMSREVLTFVPYAYHRNITATGTLDVDDDTTLNRELTVRGQTHLYDNLTVESGNTALKGDLTVDGETNLNSTLNVNNKSATNLSGALTVGEYNGTPDVDAPTILNGSLEVKGTSTFGALESRTLKVTDSTELNGAVEIKSENNQVKITSTLKGSDLNINDYPLLVEGGNQGIAIKVDTIGANNSNNFISFWDATPNTLITPYQPTAFNAGVRKVFELIGLDDAGIFDGFSNNASPGANTLSGVRLPDDSPMLWGRIEGETDPDEFSNNADYNLDQLSFYYDLVDGTLDLVWQLFDNTKQAGDFAAALSSSTGCAGIGACVTAPIPSIIVNETAHNIIEILKTGSAIANEVFAVYMLNTFYDNKKRFRGVSYASGAGDYAEYLPRLNINEKISYGDIVGLNGGKISKKTNGAQRMMVISYKPAVLGALPQPGEEQFYEKVAFMGQVPVKVIGIVNIGDYILPSGNGDGFGIAISPEKITTKDIKNIVGVAWEASENPYGYNLINTAVGINNNDNNPIVERLEQQVLSQKQEIKELKDLLAKTIERIDNIEENGISTIAVKSKSVNSEEQTIEVVHNGREFEIEDDIIYYQITDHDIEEAMLFIDKQINNSELKLNKGETIMWNAIKEDPIFKQKFTKRLKENFDKQIHYHKEVNRKTKH